MKTSQKEVAIQLGSARHLTGILSLTRSPTDAPPPLGVILPNAGVIHRVGPHRFAVKLAREIASAGVPVLRLDLSGLGDSGTPPDARPYAEQAVADLRSAMDAMTAATGASRFVIAGICSGAQNGWAAAVADPRVAGVWMMDPFSFPTRWTALHFWRRRLANESLRTVRQRIRRRIGRLAARFGRTNAASETKRARDRDLEAPSQDEDGGDSPFDAEVFGRDFAALAARGTALCFVYSGSRLDEYSYERQLRERFGDQVKFDRVEVQFLPSVDHTLTTRESQRVVLDQAARWCASVR